jgi:hypothetical protein
VPQQVLEVDVEVAAFAMFQGIFLEAKQPCPVISEYFNNKTKIRTWLSQETGLDLKAVKAHLSAMHACQGYVWPEHSSVNALKWIEALRSEIKQAYNFLALYSEIFSAYVAEADRYKKDNNVQGAAMSMYRELQERRIMCAVDEYLQLVGFPVRGLIHDALLFEVPSEKEFKIETVKAELEAFATQRVGYPVKFGLECAYKSGPLEAPRERIIFPDYTPFDDHRLREIFFDDGIRCLVINAGMNTGKTYEVGRFLASLPAGTALIVSTKILHAISTGGALHGRPSLVPRIKSYLDPNLDLDAFRCPSVGQLNIVQNESLHKLLGKHENGKPFLGQFDYIVLDEIRSLLKQTISEKTHKHHLKINQTLLQWFCEHSLCIALDADAFLDRAVAKFCRKELGGLWEDHELEVHKYTHQALPRTCLITFKASRFAEALKHAVDAARLYRERHGVSRPVVANCRCKRRVYELVALLFPRPEGGLPKFGDNNTFVFTGDANEGLEVFHDINKFIRENAVDLIIYSPKLTCAASIDEPVTAVFADATDKGCVVRDWGQGAGRARNVDNNLLHVLMPQGRTTISWAGSEDYEDFLADKLRRREEALSKRLREYASDLVFDSVDGKLVLFEELEKKMPQWIVNNITSTIAEEDRSNHDPATEVFRLIQYKQWEREFVDIESERACGFFVPTTEALPAAKRRKLDKAARQQVKGESEDRWFEAFERIKALPYEQLTKLQSDAQAPVRDKACGLLIWNFAHRSHSLTVQHAQWYWKHRASLFHARALTMSRQDLESVDYSKLLFIFKKKTLATAASILEAVGALRTLLNVLGVSLDSFATVDGAIVLTRAQLKAAASQIDACWQTMDRVLWRSRGDVNKTKAQPSAILRRIFHYFARLLEASKRHQKKVIEWCLKLDPVFAFLTSH